MTEVFKIELDLAGAELLLRAVSRECRVLGHYSITPQGKRRPAQEQREMAAMKQALEDLIARLRVEADKPLEKVMDLTMVGGGV